MTMTIESNAQLYQDTMTLREIVRLTGLPYYVIRRAILNDSLKALRPPGTRTWLVPRDALQAWLQAGNQGNQAGSK